MAKLKEQKNEERFSLMDIMNNYLLKFSRVPLKEKLFFTRNLAFMLKAGISLSVSLETLAKQTKNKLFAKVLKDVAESLDQGDDFAKSLRKHEKVFDELFINMVESGEISGKLEEVLAQLYIQMKKQHELISKVKGALTYPLVIIFAIVGIGIFLMTVVIPKILVMFTEASLELPLPTKILIAVSNAITQNGLMTAIGSVLFIIMFTSILKTKKGKYYFQAVLLKAPVFGSIIKKINLARFSRTISSLLTTDIMIIKAFQITSNVLGNLHYRNVLLKISEKVKKGEQINTVILEYPKLFPPVVTQMISIGEETGELDSILVELADFYEGEVDQIMENLPSIIEPILILVLGLMVGGAAVAIIMPMYTLTEAI